MSSRQSPGFFRGVTKKNNGENEKHMHKVSEFCLCPHSLSRCVASSSVTAGSPEGRQLLALNVMTTLKGQFAQTTGSTCFYSLQASSAVLPHTEV